VGAFARTVGLGNSPDHDTEGTLGADALRPRTSTYADAAGTEVVCAGQPGAPVRFAATVACPICPSLSESSSFQPCDFPYMTCFYGATASNGTSGSLPCECIPHDPDGLSSWSCAVY
jgi:hypothetical protein